MYYHRIGTISAVGMSCMLLGLMHAEWFMFIRAHELYVVLKPVCCAVLLCGGLVLDNLNFLYISEHHRCMLHLPSRPKLHTPVNALLARGGLAKSPRVQPGHSPTFRT